MKYDSSVDTLLHIKRVNELLLRFAKELMGRAIYHDSSKLREPEKSLFDEYTPKLRGCTYGSDEYKQFLSSLKVGLDNHYKHNSHHPEHYENGIDGMDLLDLVEMFVDWKAAGERHADGDILKSISINKTRFNISDQLESIFKNTVERMGLDNRNYLLEKANSIREKYGMPLLNSEQNPKRSIATEAESGDELQDNK